MIAIIAVVHVIMDNRQPAKTMAWALVIWFVPVVVNVVLEFVRKKTGNGNFSLIRGFPPKPINEINKKISELKLENGMLTQRLN